MPRPIKKSELERRFEELFSRTFHCDWQDYLIPQYKVQTGEKTYYIDYVYKDSGSRIAIEVDGHSKIRDAADSKEAFKAFLRRQNDIVSLEFTLYRFSWDDVTDSNGIRAQKKLESIFRGLIKQSQLVPKYPVANTYEPSIIETTIVPNKPKYSLIGVFVLGSLFLLITIPLLTRSGGQQAHQTKQIPLVTPDSPVIKSQPPVSQSMPVRHFLPKKAPPPLIRRPKQAVQESSPKQPPVVSHPPPRKRLTGQGESISLRSSENSTPLITLTNPIVAFNRSTGIFHNPSCEWARRCTKSCDYIPKSQALKLGGRPAKTCNPR